MSDFTKNGQENTLPALAAEYSDLVHIDSIVDDTGRVQGTVSDGGLTDDLTPTLHGHVNHGEGLLLNVLLNGSVVGSALIEADGNWSFTPSEPLVAGTENTFQVVVPDPGGALNLTSSPYVINTTAPDQDGAEQAAQVITTVYDDNSHHSTATVDTTDHHQNTLQLTLNDILSEAHDNLFIQDGHKQLAVTGDAGDVVELKAEDFAHNEWQKAGQVTTGGVQYEVYQHAGSDVELLVQHGLELHQVS